LRGRRKGGKNLFGYRGKGRRGRRRGGRKGTNWLSLPEKKKERVTRW